MNIWLSRISAVMLSGSGYVVCGLEIDDDEDREVRGVCSGLRASEEAVKSGARVEFGNIGSWCTVVDEEFVSSVSEVPFEDGERVLRRADAAERLRARITCVM